MAVTSVLRITFHYYYAEWHFVEGCHFKCHYFERRYDKCHYVECLGAA
jgi:hypothetical protein